MGLMRFILTPPERIDQAVARQAYLSGFDRTCWPVRATLSEGQLSLHRSVADSCTLQIPWGVKGHGWLTLATGSLCEQFGPYHLPLELARGTVAQVRNQVADWQTVGLAVPEKVHQLVSEAVRCLARAAVNREERAASAESAERAIATALDAADLLTATYTDQALAIRRRTEGKVPALLGAHLGASLLDERAAKQFLTSFNSAMVPLCWREIETTEGSYYWTICDKQIDWCRAHGLTVCGGPLLQLDPRGLPDWLYLWEDDFDNLLSFVSEIISAALKRYRGRVDLWVCAGRTNSAEILSLSEEDKLRLTARAIALTRSLDPQTPAVVSFDQPWAEYTSQRELDFPPLHFADALVRAGLDPAGLMLEMNVGYHPGGTLPRSALELSRQLDYWSILGLPLYASITVPSGWREDPLAQRRVTLPSDSWTPRSQQAWAARFLPLILSKPYVQGVFWNQLRDAEPHDFPHGGLFDARGHPKPALRTLASIRQAHLK